ncbi:MAG: hypothetical protein LVQ97_05350 [Candidatus Micrarchaeales archaeon]|jgi:hypothetical protein|uniref:Uncharacterized protein n=1 Tax=Candidatus Micrarchaeum acidiphilum ARMAN-2 TaxID=425595 RepID=C7DG56_MICA2|nr:MAG: hypothetical protein UNLARM2_0061 [Candidatus Micrarchaeum acidiphilum ARMAN-2]MCW6161584.1 hypothetical protein [Candidatus Micrarchaeales archaeon]
MATRYTDSIAESQNKSKQCLDMAKGLQIARGTIRLLEQTDDGYYFHPAKPEQLLDTKDPARLYAQQVSVLMDGLLEICRASKMALPSDADAIVAIAEESARAFPYETIKFMHMYAQKNKSRLSVAESRIYETALSREDSLASQIPNKIARLAACDVYSEQLLDEIIKKKFNQFS